ncbi:hypothetical protein CVT25_002724 [Psilocybe cyanescens]|uniref:Uncharacterized protein n=1 Tax=Psilocybe cyanescens TaxID=93625 RepID=A0A409XKB3_PSICY|nr:hypothetical protein CVT25_002724 [Psilocybe cyanescens]
MVGGAVEELGVQGEEGGSGCNAGEESACPPALGADTGWEQAHYDLVENPSNIYTIVTHFEQLGVSPFLWYNLDPLTIPVFFI